MAVVWAFCKTKMVCEGDEVKEETDGADPAEEKKGHGGCGAVQPQVRKEGLKMFVQYKKPKDDDEVCHTSLQSLQATNSNSRRSNLCSQTSVS